MKKISLAAILAIVSALLVFTLVLALISNGDFETGNFTNWVKSAFINNGFSSPAAGGSDLSTVVYGASPMSIGDPHTNNNLKYPAYGNYTAMVNNDLSYTGGGYAKNANTITQNYTAVLDSGDGLAHVRFTYAAVMVDPVDNPHTAEEKPYFRVRVINASNSNDVIYDFSSYVGEPGKNWQNGTLFSGSDYWKYIDWTYVDLSSNTSHPVNAGDNIVVEITAAGCSLGGHPGYVYVDEVTDGDIAGPSINASGPSTTTPGSTITYTYDYVNGSGITVDPEIIINQPIGVTFTSVSDATNCSLSGGTVTCNFTGIGAGIGSSFTVDGNVSASSGTQIAHGDYYIGATGFPTVGGQTVLTDVNGSPLPNGWGGTVVVTSNKNILTVGRPHLGSQIVSYDGYPSGSLTAYLPMLFDSAWGTYNAEFYIQNVDNTNTANFTINFYDIDGNHTCSFGDSLAKLASKNYSLASINCSTGSLNPGWVGGAIIESDHNVVAVGRPIIGTQEMTYNSFQNGSTTIYVPMLFKNIWGYNSALYIQNVDPSNTATFTLDFYDKNGDHTCSMPSQQRAPLAAKGYWLPAVTCVPDGWAGGVVITSDYPLVALGRIHAGDEITTYSGIIETSATTYVPMLFRTAFGGDYNTALYIQNVDANTSDITIDFYSSAGTHTCTMNQTLSSFAAWGYWLPSATCVPDGWAGSAVVTSTSNVVAVARPHIGTEVTAYPGLPTGGTEAYLPLLYKNGGIDNNYNSALYVQNLESSISDISIKLYDTSGALSCEVTDTLAATAVKGYWLPAISSCP
ncbi:MAG: hypothetical protein H6634_15605 [Anaerolineales bacterium]|nr:hypothetical protein [Anaerolineales bacterium]